MSRKGDGTGPLATSEGLAEVQAALKERDLDGWLLYDFKDRNPIARSLLGLEWTTRRAFALVPAEGDPRLLIHAIEHSSWTHLDWERASYAGWPELHDGLARLLDGLDRVAAEVSEEGRVPYLDLLPSGMVEVIRKQGVELVSSGDLVSSFYAVWSDAQRQEHGRASQVVKQVAREAFDRVAAQVAQGESPTEGAVSRWICQRLADAGTPDQADCIVAIGPKAADPHYSPGAVGEEIRAGDLLLIDLWGGVAKGSVPADQTWMGFLGSSLPDRFEEIWQAVRGAREAAISFLRQEFSAGREIRGYQVDDVARGVIREAGYGDAFIHRTGHSIDRDLHGRGPNLDNLETQDDRILVPGVGFSVEPGIYLKDDVGMRTEVNVFMGPSGPEVTVDEPQERVFLLLSD